jgi:phosphoribosyl-dephospho-CoA transferase
MTTFACPHDLLELKSVESVHGIACAPEWVKKSLLTCCYAVARRARLSGNDIAIGVRGAERNERWAGSISSDDIKMVTRPFEIRTTNRMKPGREIAVPALRNLKSLENQWSGLELGWGPGGSVGFELVTGFPTATHSSDLDIVLFAPHHFSQDFANQLLLSAREIGNAIDVLVEAPECAFSLAEYATSGNGSIMLRSFAEPILGTDPWSFSLAQSARQSPQALSEKQV